MNKKVLQLSKIVGIVAIYSMIFVASIFFTMSLLIKGEEIVAPDLLGKNLKLAYEIASRKGIYLKKVPGDFGSAYTPNTVVNQFPSPGTAVKEKSVIKVFVASSQAQVIVPNLTQQSLKECEEQLKKSKLKRGMLSYITVDDIPAETVVTQSTAFGSRVSENSSIDLLVSRGAQNPSYVMPDLIGKPAARVLVYFESRGLKISKIEEVAYFGLKPGVILKQFPPPGFEISPRNLISIQVSQ